MHDGGLGPTLLQRLIPRDVRAWARLALPATARAACELAPWLTTLAFLGRVGTQTLAAVSLVEAWMYSWMVITWTGLGMTSHTLVSQAHGARSVPAMRAALLMSLAVMGVLTLVVSALWVVEKPILLAAGFDAALVDEGYVYTLWALPNLWLEALNIPIGAYVSGLQRADLAFLVQLTTAGLDIAVTYVLVFTYGFGLKGSAWGWTAGSTLTLLQYAVILPWLFRGGRELKYGHEEEDEDDEDEEEGGNEEDAAALGDNDKPSRPLLLGMSSNNESTLPGPPLQLNGEPAHLHPSSSSLWALAVARLGRRRNWTSFASQCGPNLATAALQQWQLQVLSFLAAELGAVDIAAHNTSIALFEVALTIPQGMAEATSVRVGHLLGRGPRGVRRAKQTALLGLIVAVLWGAVACGAGYSLRSYTGRIFTDDPAVLSIHESLAPVFWAGYFVLCVGWWALGVLEGQGRATGQTASYLFGGWIVMIPCAVCAWKFRPDWGLEGLWGALLVGDVVLTACSAALVLRSDWSALAEEAQGRSDEGQDEEDDGVDGEGVGDKTGS
jgi:Na+-driven multidrug efflux pump